MSKIIKLKFLRTTKLLLLIWVFAYCKKPTVDPINKEDPKEEQKPDEKPKPAEKPKYQEEDTWIYQQMKKYYLWEDKMPKEDSTDKNLDPVKYFNTLLYSEKDRYSYAKPDSNEIFDYWNGNLTAFGFRYTLVEDEMSTVRLAVSMVLRGSPSERAGLRRGDLIQTINGGVLSKSNIKKLLDNHQVNFSIVHEDGKTAELKISKEKFKINPLQYHSILQVGSLKVGYLVYSQFLFGFDDETQAVFKYFAENQIDEMVLDLRFNPGGVTPIAEVMTSYLSPGLGAKQILFYGSGNAYQKQENIKETGVPEGKRYFVPLKYSLNHLKRIFVITSKSTSSSSELLINCLRPYRPVITVGGNTYGKNLISYIIKSEKYSFALMPAWSTIINVNGEMVDSKEGIRADYTVEENLLPYFPLGDINENLLRKTLSLFAELPKSDKKQVKVKLLDPYHHFDTGSGFLDNERYNP